MKITHFLITAFLALLAAAAYARPISDAGATSRENLVVIIVNVGRPSQGTPPSPSKSPSPDQLADYGRKPSEAPPSPKLSPPHLQLTFGRPSTAAPPPPKSSPPEGQITIQQPLRQQGSSPLVLSSASS